MSVWASDSQILDLAKHLYLAGPDYIERILGADPHDTLRCDPTIIPDLYTDCWESLAEYLHWPLAEQDATAYEHFTQLAKSITTWRVGIHAIYTLVDEVRRGRFICRPAFDRNFIQDTVDETMTLVCPSTQITPARFISRAKQTSMASKTPSERWEDVAEALKHARFLFTQKKDGLIELEHTKYLGGPPKSFVGYVYNNLLYFFGRNQVQQVGLVLSRQNFDYLIGALTRLGNLTQYVLRHQNQETANEQLCYLDEMIRDAAKARRKNANYVAMSSQNTCNIPDEDLRK